LPVHRRIQKSSTPYHGLKLGAIAETGLTTCARIDIGNAKLLWQSRELRFHEKSAPGRIMLDALLELIVEFVVEFISQLLIEIGFEWVAEFFHRRPTLSTVLTFVAIPLFGGFVGFILSNTIPWRIFRNPIIPGISLLLSPIATGLVMKLFGDWRRSRGHQPTVLATFWGGALFAFSMALVRWLRVG